MVTPAPPGGWNFSPGDAIREEAWRRFRSPFLIEIQFVTFPDSFLRASKPDQQRIYVFHQLGQRKMVSVTSPTTSKAADAAQSSIPATELITHAKGTRDPNLSPISNLENTPCGRCLEKGHSQVSCSGPLRCRACRMPGHLARFCLTTKPTKAQHPKNPKPSARTTAVWKAKTNTPKISPSSS
uniref:CCHC-type domain-containing protein n=1 Tax=Oryza meridionalis TaxID=40149 RepID=A0A0E0E1U1_9ORYZ